MARLFPPVIEGIVPAFYDNEENGMIEVVIPFSMNRAVSQAQVKGLAVKVKTVQSSNYLYTGKVTDALNYDLENSCWVRVSINKSQAPQMKAGQFYKFQIAYIDSTYEVGYYSTVGVGKYTTRPQIEINEMVQGQINTHVHKYMGHYSQKDGDTSEAEYSYQFDIYDTNDNVIYTTNERLHNSSNDTELYESYDDFFYSSDLPINKVYRIKYTVTTINGLVISSPRYRIMQKLTIDPEIQATLEAEANFDNGYISINLVGAKDENGLEKTATGAFLLTRASSSDGYSTWDEISRFKLAAQVPSLQLWKDFTIEQGKEYKYSLQQYNDNGLYSNRIYSNIVYGDFEDAFLYDGKRQLKIKYNPKVSSFKKDVLETKIDTIGSKHPFIFRNGNVNYKEFPISGLISYLMDEENLFSTQEEMIERTTNLTGKNIAQERDFKMEVYEWLTNGESKLFRSPSEGNFIVRLMNVSLTPNDTLGRMLHTFNATAYEVAEYNYTNLSSFGFIRLEDPEVAQLRFETIDLGETYYNTELQKRVYTYADGVPINRHPIYTVRLTDLIPGDRLILSFNNRPDQLIQIGVTGSYYVDLGTAIKSIRFDTGVTPKGSMTYSYYSIQSNVFDKISNVTITEIPGQQFIGEHDILKEIEYVKRYNSSIGKTEWVKNPKIDILEVYTLSAQRRSIEKVKRKIENSSYVYYKDRDCKVPLEDNKDIFTLYAYGDWKQKKSYMDVNDPSYKPYDKFNWKFETDGYVDFANNAKSSTDYEPYLYINGSQISVEDIRDFSIGKFGKIKELSCGNGCNVEISYQIRIIDYSIEDNDTYDVKGRKNAYLTSVKILNDLINSRDEIDNVEEFAQKEKEARQIVKSNYEAYILALISAQEEEKALEELA